VQPSVRATVLAKEIGGRGESPTRIPIRPIRNSQLSHSLHGVNANGGLKPNGYEQVDTDADGRVTYADWEAAVKYNLVELAVERLIHQAARSTSRPRTTVSVQDVMRRLSVVLDTLQVRSSHPKSIMRTVVTKDCRVVWRMKSVRIVCFRIREGGAGVLALSAST
jgi:hypothetical protein